ncbi:MAG: uL15 family ribosomal protein [Candidatus Aenigmarchaeota archaeon]|nr:uL15 family ribosomal protein [Candidatus Aenigmarchaeota archaeon]
MVVRKRKKVRKFRGHRTYGYGSHKKHRGKGSRGGRGLAGLHKHKWSYTVKYAQEHFGKRGFKRPVAVKKEIRAINLKELDQLAEKLLEEKIAEKQEDKIKINVLKLGYEKVLGSGKITKPLIVEAKLFSEQAIKKIEEAKGKAVIVE